MTDLKQIKMWCTKIHEASPELIVVFKEMTELSKQNKYQTGYQGLIDYVLEKKSYDSLQKKIIEEDIIPKYNKQYYIKRIM